MHIAGFQAMLVKLTKCVWRRETCRCKQVEDPGVEPGELDEDQSSLY